MSIGHRSPSLDGLRGLALVAVVAYHAAPAQAPGGFLGVEILFVLSGFLLSANLIAEHGRTGALNFRRFAERRLRRIVPALSVLLGTLLVLGPVLAPDAAHRLAGDLASSAAGITNWHLINDGASYFRQAGRPSSARHLWSVAVEIQFYLLCPFLVAWLVRRRHWIAVALLLVAIALSVGLMSAYYQTSDPSRAYYGTDSRIGALLTGVVLAFVLSAASRDHPAALSGPGSGWRDGSAGVGSLVVLIGLILVVDDRSSLSYPAAFLATQAATASLIIALGHDGLTAAALGWKPLRWLGVRSFGIYLWYWPLAVLLRPDIDVTWSPLVAGVIGVAGAAVLGALSWRLVERPALEGNQGLQWAKLRAYRTVIGVALVVGGVGLFSRLPTVDPIAASLLEGQRILDLAVEVTVPAGQLPFGVPATTQTSLAPVTTLTPAGPSAEAPPKAPVGSIVTIGDSVMVSSAAVLKARLGPEVTIDAVLNRKFREAIGVAQTLRRDGRLPQVVVVHLGGNGPIRGDEVDALMRDLAGVPRVLLVTVRIAQPWRESVNQVLTEAATRYPTVTVVDWYAASAGHLDWFQGDGTHFRTTSGPGATAYANLIGEAIGVPPPPSE